jgi:hypothetical protein
MFKFIKWLMIILVATIVGLALTFLRADIPAAEAEALYANEASEFIVLENGQRVHYRDEGNADGPPLILVHGSSASLHTWEQWVGLLGDEFRIISMDSQGHGLTGPSI